jgi:hypothetical protein
MRPVSELTLSWTQVGQQTGPQKDKTNDNDVENSDYDVNEHSGRRASEGTTVAGRAAAAVVDLRNLLLEEKGR